jgi:hypothetical protein
MKFVRSGRERKRLRGVITHTTKKFGALAGAWNDKMGLRAGDRASKFSAKRR